MQRLIVSHDGRFYLIALFLANAGLVSGSVFVQGYYYPHRVLTGEFYRLFTHPFVHVSWWHLLLDGTAFLALYAMLETPSWIRRTAYVLGAHLGCTLGVTWNLGWGESIGYAGLSGIAHGLMAVWALELLFHPKCTLRPIGTWTLIIVTGKALCEALSGRMLFDFMHAGRMGQPIAISHLSGIIGACVVFALYRAWGKRKS
jgi:membrane associated rhomboid family serine protease